MSLATRGELYRRLHDYDAATRDLSTAIDLASYEPASFELSRRAAVYLASGYRAEAEADIARVVELTPKRGSDFYNSAVVFVLSGDHNKAISLLEEAVRRDPSAWTYAQIDDLLEPLKSHSKFQEIANRSFRT